MENTCRYAKTARAWEALARPGVMDRRTHTLLLMANGRRSVRELERLMDGDVQELARRLTEQGYLQESAGLAAEAVPDEDANTP